MKLVWMPAANRDRETIIRFIAEDSIAAALSLDDRIDASCTRLIDFPTLGRIGRASDTRELVIHPNYILVYRIRSDVIEILTVLHAAQRWP